MFVISASAPRAGSSWYFNMTNDMLIEAGHVDIRALYQAHDLGHLMNYPNCNVSVLHGNKVAQLAALSWRRGTYVVKTHEKPTRSLRWLTAMHQAKSTYIYRDPRDRIVSIMEVAKKLRAEGVRNRNFAIVENFDDALNFVQSPLQHLNIWQKHPQTLTVRYEDLMLNTLGGLQRLNTFLGLSLSDGQLQSVVTKYDRHAIQPDVKANSHLVHGDIGRYKEALTDEQIQKIHDRLGDEILALGYAI